MSLFRGLRAIQTKNFSRPSPHAKNSLAAFGFSTDVKSGHALFVHRAGIRVARFPFFRKQSRGFLARASHAMTNAVWRKRNLAVRAEKLEEVGLRMNLETLD
jgi:hypothetical protein